MKKEVLLSLNDIDEGYLEDARPKVKRKPIIKFVIKGKTLNAYLGLNPEDYQDTKYIFTNVSNVKKYANYPMRVKVSSNRQVKWVKELIQEILQK